MNNDFDLLTLPFCPAQKDGRGVEADRAALVAIYHATDEASWTNKRNWLSDRPLEELDGIRTDDLGRVIVLNLSSKHLRGHLPRELGLLSKLERLDLRNNALTGEIPAELGNLTNLKYIDLRFNGLTGEIPAELGQLSNLKYLNLAGNKLTGEIPAELGKLSNLEWLDISDGNEFTGCVPDGLRDVISSDFARLRLPFCEAR